MTSDLSMDIDLEDVARDLPPVRVVAPHYYGGGRRDSEDSITHQLDSIIPGIIDPLNVIRTPLAARKNLFNGTTTTTVDSTGVTSAARETAVHVAEESRAYLPPAEWLNLGSHVDHEDVTWFPDALFKYLLRSSTAAAADPGLLAHYKRLVVAVFRTVYGPGSSPGTTADAAMVVRSFTRLTCPTWSDELAELVLRAYRTGVKL